MFLVESIFYVKWSVQFVSLMSFEFVLNAFDLEIILSAYKNVPPEKFK